jgi:hypothetical protein
LESHSQRMSTQKTAFYTAKDCFLRHHAKRHIFIKNVSRFSRIHLHIVSMPPLTALLADGGGIAVCM